MLISPWLLYYRPLPIRRPSLESHCILESPWRSQLVAGASFEGPNSKPDFCIDGIALPSHGLGRRQRHLNRRIPLGGPALSLFTARCDSI
jgi:hypothetical protein